MRSPSDAVGSPFAFDSGALSTNANVEPVLSSLNVKVAEPCAEALEPRTSAQAPTAGPRANTRRVTRGETLNIKYLPIVDVNARSLRRTRPGPPGADVPSQSGISMQASDSNNHFCLVLATAVVCVVLAFAITENGAACHRVHPPPLETGRFSFRLSRAAVRVAYRCLESFAGDRAGHDLATNRGRRLAALRRTGWLRVSRASSVKNSRYVPRPATLRALRLGLF
jgi:hypothetical protein